MPFPRLDLATIGTLYTLSCRSEAGLRQTLRLMQHRHCMLVDLRPLALMKADPEWTREALDLRYNIVEQTHLPSRLRETRSIWDEQIICTTAQRCRDRLAEPAIARLVDDLLAGRDVILLCACRNEACCRRLTVAKLMQDALAVRLFAGKEESMPCQICPPIPSCVTTP